MTTYQYYCAEDDSEDHDDPFTPGEYDGEVINEDGEVAAYWYFNETSDGGHWNNTDGSDFGGWRFDDGSDNSGTWWND